MKYLYTLFAILWLSKPFAQESLLQKKESGLFELSEVVTVQDFPAAQLFLNSKLFLTEAFRSVRETSQIKDEKAKSVATKGSFPVMVTNGYGEQVKAKVVFTLVIQSRENMYRYTLNDFYFAYTEETGITSYASFNDRRGVAMTPNQWKEVEQQSEEFFSDFIEDLKEQMEQDEILCKEAVSLRKKQKN